jgi:hypothetical protein
MEFPDDIGGQVGEARDHEGRSASIADRGAAGSLGLIHRGYDRLSVGPAWPIDLYRRHAGAGHLNGVRQPMDISSCHDPAPQIQANTAIRGG